MAELVVTEAFDPMLRLVEAETPFFCRKQCKWSELVSDKDLLSDWRFSFGSTMVLAGDALVVGIGVACFGGAVFCFGCSFAAGACSGSAETSEVLLSAVAEVVVTYCSWCSEVSGATFPSMLVSAPRPRLPSSGLKIAVSAGSGANSTSGELGRVGTGELGRDMDLGRGSVTSSLSFGTLCVMVRAALQGKENKT